MLPVDIKRAYRTHTSRLHSRVYSYAVSSRYTILYDNLGICDKSMSENWQMFITPICRTSCTVPLGARN